MAAMPRNRIAPGTVGPVSTTPLGWPTTCRPDGDTPTPEQERVIPLSSDSMGTPHPHPAGLKAGQSVKVETIDGITEWQVCRWRGLARAVDVDNSEHMIRRWRPTRAAAEAAVRQAGLDKLAQLARARQAQAEASRATAEGDTVTTVTDLIGQVLASPGFAKLAPKTRQDYRYASRYVVTAPIGGMLPRHVDVASVRRFLETTAAEHGRGSARHARAVLSRAMDAATESAAMRVAFNPVTAVRDAIPDVTVRSSALDHKRAPSDAEVEALLVALRADPEAGPMIDGRHKSSHGAAGTAPVNGRDIADLALLLFRTGTRLGEAAGLRWADVDLTAGELHITGTLSFIAGEGTVRQDRTKTTTSTRHVPMSADLLAALVARAELFGIDGELDGARPVFGSPQHPERWRDYRNLSRAVALLFERHGLDYARGHVGRKWRVTSLVARGVPVAHVSDLVGHSSVATTYGYLGRGSAASEAVRAAL